MDGSQDGTDRPPMERGLTYGRDAEGNAFSTRPERPVRSVDDDLQSWSFEVDQVSPGVYRGRATHRDGRTFELTRKHPDEALRLLRERAPAMTEPGS